MQPLRRRRALGPGVSPLPCGDAREAHGPAPGRLSPRRGCCRFSNQSDSNLKCESQAGAVWVTVEGSTCCSTGDRPTFSGSPEQKGFALPLCLARMYVLSHKCYSMYRSTLREINPPHMWRYIYSKLENPQSLLVSVSLLASFPMSHQKKKKPQRNCFQFQKYKLNLKIGTI